MRLLTAWLLGVVILAQVPTDHADTLQASSPADLRVLGAAVYKCGQIRADVDWIAAIDGTQSSVKFAIDRTKSARDWTTNRCDAVLSIFGLTR